MGSTLWRSCAAIVLIVVGLMAPAGAATGAAARAPGPFELHDLGTLGGVSSFGRAINNRGQVVGSSQLANGLEHAFLWQHGSMVDLGTLAGPGGTSVATDINDAGDVVGYSSTPDGSSRGFLWRRGTLTDLGSLGSGQSAAIGVNDRGQVVGFSADSDLVFRPFLWSRGRMSQLATPPGGATYSEANAINNRGHAVGLAINAPCGVCGPVLWRGGTAFRLPLLAGAVTGGAHDINESGQVAGYVGPLGLSDTRATIWNRTGVVDLGLPEGSSQAMALNDRGQVTGSYNDLGFVWDHGDVTFLSKLDPQFTSSAWDINDRGQVAGFGIIDAAANTHAVIWD